MCGANKDAKFSLKVMVNKEKRRVVFAEVDSSFLDVLLSFLTLPLGTIVRNTKKQYGDGAPVFGSLTTLYNTVENLDSDHFWTEGAKSMLLHPRSSSQVECKSLKLDLSDSPPSEYLVCTSECSSSSSVRFRSVSMYLDKPYSYYPSGIQVTMKKEVAIEDTCAALFNDGVFTMKRVSFVITDDMQIVPTDTGLLQVVSSLGVTDADKAELMNLTFGYAEVMDLLMALMISSTPLSDIILNRTGLMNSKKRKYEQRSLPYEIAYASTSCHEKMILKVMLQKSTKQFLYALAEKDFLEFLFSFLVIPIGGVVSFFEGRSLIKSMDSLYRTIASDDLILSKHFTTPGVKYRLIQPKILHGYISGYPILPLIEEELPSIYAEFKFSSENFPEGEGNYLKKQPSTFLVTDDLTVTPFCIAPALSILNGMKIPLSDVEEVEMQIGLKEASSILKASLTSPCALSNGLNLISQMSSKQSRQKS